MSALKDLVMSQIADPAHNTCYDSLLVDINYILDYINTVLPTMPPMDQPTAQMTVDDIQNYINDIGTNFGACLATG